MDAIWVRAMVFLSPVVIIVMMYGGARVGIAMIAEAWWGTGLGALLGLYASCLVVGIPIALLRACEHVEEIAHSVLRVEQSIASRTD